MTDNQQLKPAEEEEIREAQRQYYAGYYKKNKKRIIERSAKWNQENAERRKEINRNYWLRKKKKMNDS